jgi:hypothetical protein
MLVKGVKSSIFVAAAMLLAATCAVAQVKGLDNKNKAQEVDLTDTPAPLEHLPDYDSVASRAVFATDANTLKRALGEHSELDLIDFTAETEAATAPYPAGKLLIVEYSSPQASSEADARFQQAVAGKPSILYRRIGNYNAFVFDVADAAAANALLDQIHYEKQIQWLGDAPAKPSHGVSVPQMANVLLSSVMWIVGCGVLAILGGGVVGWLYWRRMKQRRAAMSTFTDAGGMTRLNLDGFTPDTLPDRLLGK